jgi:hypothetical protein
MSDDSPQSFWSTTTGVITALAGLLGAVAAVITALHLLSPTPTPVQPQSDTALVHVMQDLNKSLEADNAEIASLQNQINNLKQQPSASPTVIAAHQDSLDKLLKSREALSVRINATTMKLQKR